MFKIAFAFALLVVTIGMLAQTRNTDAPELHRIQSEYSDVLALQGTAKAELLAIACVLRAKPEMAIDRTKAAGEYCFKSSESSMVHYASQPESTMEDGGTDRGRSSLFALLSQDFGRKNALSVPFPLLVWLRIRAQAI